MYRSAFRQTVVVGALVGTLGACLCGCGGGVLRADRAKRVNHLTMIPTPKQIKMAGDPIQLSGDELPVIVIGKNACRQSQIGADWICDTSVRLRGPTLRRVPVDKLPSDVWALVIGTIKDNPLVRQAVEKGMVDVGSGNPGERGYEIKVQRKTKRIYLAGVDPIGALYACVTLGHLIEHEGDNLVLRTADIRDWPDAIYAMPSSNLGWGGLIGLPEVWATRPKSKIYLKETKELTPEAFQETLDVCRRNIDRLLAHKLAMIRFKRPYELRGERLNIEELGRYDVFREAIAYAKERGIGIMGSGFNPFVGLKKDYPEYAELSLKGSSKMDIWIRCWGLDDIRRKTAANIAEFAHHMGFTDIWFHDTDAGLYLNPAQWNDRNEQDRKRWGDDYAAAVINKHMIHVEELRKLSPNIRIHFTLVPYGCNILDVRSGAEVMQWVHGDNPDIMKLAEKMHVKYVDFFKRVSDAFPEGVYLQIREADGVSRQKFNELLGNRPICTWYAVNPLYPFFSPTSSMLKEICNHVHSVVKPAYCDNLVPLNSLAIREYMWNTKTPGMQTWPYSFGFDHKLITDFLERSSADEDVYRVVLPRVARALFGREIAPDITEAVSLPLVFKSIFGYARFRFIKDITDTPAFMKKQAELAEKGMAALDRAWATFQADPNKLWLEPHQVRYLVYLREMFHTSMWTARLQYYQFQARDLATDQGDQEAAETAARRGLELAAEAKADMAKLVGERPPDPLLETYRRSSTRRLKNPGSDGHRKWQTTRAHVWYGMLADSMDFYYEEKDLETLLKNIPLLARIKDVPDNVLDDLQNQPVFAVRTATPIQVDGVLDEPAWQQSYPRESFFILRTSNTPKIALADTCAKTAYDDNHLYIAMECRLPDGAVLSRADIVEIFVQNPAQKGDYVHFTLRASGKARHQYRRLSRDEHGFVSYTSDNKWLCEGLTFAAKLFPKERKWIAEVSLSLDSIGSGPLSDGFRVNYARDCRSSGLREISSILNPGIDSFHHVEGFKPISLKGDTSFVSEVSLQAPEFKAEEKTRTTGVATVATFKLAVRANRVLHNVAISAEGTNAAGENKGKRKLLEKASIAYSWHSVKTFELPFQDVARQGHVTILLTSDEATQETVIPFGK